MSAVLKPKRITDRKVILECKKDYCEYCGRPAQGEPHHIRPRSLGGSDIKENQIQLCFDCHRAVHDGKLSYTVLVPIVAKREDVSVPDVYAAIEWPMPDDVQFETENPALTGLAGYTLDDMIQAYISLQVDEDDVKWQKAAICAALLEGFGMKASQVASLLGCSAANVRVMAKVFMAFPDSDDRVIAMSFTHHKIAVQYAPENPQEWVEKAADNEWSTRQLTEAIRGNESEEARKDIKKGKTEMIKRLTLEVLAEGGEEAKCLIAELLQILKEKSVV